MKLPSGECQRALPMASQHWFIAIRQQDIICANVVSDLCHHKALLGYIGLNKKRKLDYINLIILPIDLISWHIMAKLTHWVLGDVAIISKVLFSNSSHRIAAYAFAMKLLPVEDTRSLLIEKSTLVQVIAWCHQATSHNLGQCWPRFMSSYGFTRPQQVQCNEKKWD